MQFQSDPFLGWTTIEGRDYLVRQLNDHKASVELDELKSAGLLEYAAVCGETLARGHARAGDPCHIAGYIGTSARFDDAIAQVRRRLRRPDRARLGGAGPRSPPCQAHRAGQSTPQRNPAPRTSKPWQSCKAPAPPADAWHPALTTDY